MVGNLGISGRLAGIFARIVRASSPPPAPLTEKDFYTEIPSYLKDLYEDQPEPAKDPGNPQIETSLLIDLAAAGDLRGIQTFLVAMPSGNLADTAGEKTLAEIANENGHCFTGLCLEILARRPALEHLFRSSDHEKFLAIMGGLSQQERDETLLDAARIGFTEYLTELAVHYPETDLMYENETEGKAPLEIAREAGQEKFAQFLSDLIYPVKPSEPENASLQRAYDSGDQRRIELITRSLANNGYGTDYTAPEPAEKIRAARPGAASASPAP